MFSLALCATAVNAQQVSADPVRQALAQKMIKELQAEVECSASLIGANDYLAKAEARIKDLEDQYEPKKAEKPVTGK
jgi:hypothetical protein